jgi:predicted ATPase/class 3 adenylate cyclase
VRANLPTGTVTFLFTDIEGSTRLLQGLGPEYRVVLERHAAVLREALRTHDGVEVSTEGDAFFAVFRSAERAVGAAVAAQRSLAAEQWPNGHPVRVRMGLHTGEGQLGGDSYVGLDVHRTARIAAAGHGGQVLLSSATRALVDHALPVGAWMRDLGAHRLKDLDDVEHISQVVVPGLEQEFPPLRSLETPSSLPPEPSSFIGRERELDAISVLLAKARLLTLTGPGGTGKTRLAIRTGARVGPHLRDGVFFVDLAPLSGPDLVGPTIARSVGLVDQADRPVLDLLHDYLEPRELLLILDNFEHVLAAASFVDGLLRRAAKVKVLVTSRTVLNLYGEQTFDVAPLALPDVAETSAGDNLSSNDAVALFLDRARAADASFELTPESARAVAEICVRLDGLPLAIELVASGIRVLRPREILLRLEQHLPVPSAGASNTPARQRTLRSTIDWSYQLLQAPERKLFARLAIFAGGCTLDAVDAVCNPDGELGLSTLDGLARLVDHSLVRRHDAPGASRFGMLETILDFGREELEAGGDMDRVAARHTRYYRDLAATAEPHFMGAAQVAWLDRFEQEHGNLRAVLSRLLEAGDAEGGLALAASLWRFWQQRGYLWEGRSWLEALLELPRQAVSRTRAKAFVALGGLAYWLADADATERAYEAAMSAARQLGDREAEGEALYNLGFVPVMRGEHEEARRRFERGLAFATNLASPHLVARNKHSLGILLVVAGDPQAGLELLEDALGYFRASGDRFQVAWTLGEMGRAHRLLGQHRDARTRYLEGLRMHAEAKNLPGIGASLDSLSALESEAGHHAEAMRLMSAAATLTSTIGASPPPLYLGRVEDAEERARQAIGDAAVEEELARGRAMSVAEAVDYAARTYSGLAD